MKKENWLSLILPGIYILPALAIMVFLCSGGIDDALILICWLICGVPVLMIAIGSSFSVFMIIKYKLNIGKHILIYILTTLASAAAIASSVFFYIFESGWAAHAVAVVISGLTIFLYCKKIKDKKELAVMILCSPILYFTIALMFDSLLMYLIIISFVTG